MRNSRTKEFATILAEPRDLLTPSEVRAFFERFAAARNSPSGLCYTGASMDRRGAKLSIVEAFLCLWVIAAQIWYLLQFGPLVTFFAARFFHKS